MALNVVALISGGKDSLFSILHCMAQGHRVVALANLYPAASEDSDSFMYQTIGHRVIPSFEKALGIPLYRQEIEGAAVNQRKSYERLDGPEPDEVESLFKLLQRVMHTHPDVDAVSSGAVLSDYQRTRVESVALRLGLTPLAYLWQYPYLPPYRQSSLLRDMEAVGQDARIIKVASGGLGESRLWMNVASEAGIEYLFHDMSRFGPPDVGVILGEGGEYETLAVDGPAPLWKYRIDISRECRTVVSGEGGVCSLVVSSAASAEKDQSKPGHLPRCPSMWDDAFASILHGTGDPMSSDRHRKFFGEEGVGHPQYDGVASGRSATYFSNFTAAGNKTTAWNGVDVHDVASAIPAQMSSIMSKLSHELEARSLEFEDISYVTILVRNMGDFAAVNEIYGKGFAHPNPPARATVACGEMMPDNVDVMISAIAQDRNGFARDALHVQSRSYWAPANIGPYSQAVGINIQQRDEHRNSSDVVYVAGQIALIPATMTIVSADFKEQATLSLQHLWRIGRRMFVDSWAPVVAFITASENGEAQTRAKLAGSVWRAANNTAVVWEDSEEKDEDVADASLYRHAHRRANMDELDRVQCSSILEPKRDIGGTCLVAQVDALPRSAIIEWAGLGTRGALSQALQTSHMLQDDKVVRTPRQYLMGIETISERGAVSNALKSAANALYEFYTTPLTPAENVAQAKGIVIPCKTLWDDQGSELVAAIRYRSLDFQDT